MRTQRAKVRRRWLVALIMAVAVMAPASVGAQGDAVPDGVTVLGDHGPWTAFSGRFGFIYGSVGHDYVVIGGDPIERVCDSLPPETLALTKQQPDGTWYTHIPLGGVSRDLYVYEKPAEVFVFDWIGPVCEEIAGGAEPPAPFVVGEGNQRAKSWVAETGYWDDVGVGQLPGRHWNAIGGDAFDAEGNRYRVFAEVDLQLFEDRPPDVRSEVMIVRPAG